MHGGLPHPHPGQRRLPELDDPRIVRLFITPIGAFKGSGNDVFPIINFAAFYVTGYIGDPCPNATPNLKNGQVAGYFIKFVPGSSTGTGSNPCPPPPDPRPCVAVLEK